MYNSNKVGSSFRMKANLTLFTILGPFLLLLLHFQLHHGLATITTTFTCFHESCYIFDYYYEAYLLYHILQSDDRIVLRIWTV